MMYVAVISALFVVAGFGMLFKFGAGNSAAIEAAASQVRINRKMPFLQAPRDGYKRQFDEAVASYR